MRRHLERAPSPGSAARARRAPGVVPMPKAIAPNAPWVRGVAVAAGDGHARLGQAVFGSDDVDDALVGAGQVEKRHAELAAVVLERRHHLLGQVVGERTCWPSVGTMWSTVANVRSGKATHSPRRRSMSNACGSLREPGAGR